MYKSHNFIHCFISKRYQTGKLRTRFPSTDEAIENLHMLNLQEQRRKQLEHELEMNASQITKQRLIIRQLEKDKDRSGWINC